MHNFLFYISYIIADSYKKYQHPLHTIYEKKYINFGKSISQNEQDVRWMIEMVLMI
jgi:hypothetical protein